MMADATDKLDESKIKITIKTPKEKHDVDVSIKATVQESLWRTMECSHAAVCTNNQSRLVVSSVKAFPGRPRNSGFSPLRAATLDGSVIRYHHYISSHSLKEEVARKFGCSVEQTCLIFAGKILKDPDSLEQHNIKNGLTIHLVIKTSSRHAESEAPGRPENVPTSTQPNLSQTPFGLGGIGGLPGLDALGMGSSDFMEMQQRMQRGLLSNPELLSQLVDNPMVQQMMSNPEITRQLMLNNPQMQEVLERNPEITHMLNNPDLMRQTMELVRNPSMLQELMRTQDRAMSNLESLPGGFNALQRMYHDIQEPMMNAAQESLGSNPFASLVTSSSNTGSAAQPGRENIEPMPNPWAGGGSGYASATTSTASSISTSSAGFTSGLLGSQGSLFNSPGMQSLMQQMTQNPQMMTNMLQAPYMQTMMQSLTSNPELAQQIIGNNPMLTGNPQLQAQFRNHLPTILQQISNPDVQATVGNPRAMEAIQQIQQGLQTLQTESPSFFPSISGLAGVQVPTTCQDTSTVGNNNTAGVTGDSVSAAGISVPSAPVLDASSASTATLTTSSVGTAPSAGDQRAFTNMMSQLMGMMVQGNLNQPPEQRYGAQLEQLQAMGFPDRDANIGALTATLGDVNAAIDRLLQQR